MRQALDAEQQADNRQVADSTSETSLRAILPSARFVAADDIPFDELAESPQSCTAGDLVVYRLGKDDPTQLVANALARGAVGILTEQLLPCPLPQCIVGDTEIALARIASNRLESPDRKLLTVGVIGSAGKTTTALLVSTLLRSFGYRTAFQTDLGDCDGIVQQTSKQQVPANSALVRWFGDVADAGSQAAIIELSDEQARQGAYDAIEFDILIVAGDGSCSTDFGPSGLQCALDRLTPDAVVIAPSEDAKTMTLIRDCEARLLTYSVRKAADLSAKLIDQSGGMSTLMVTHLNTTAVMETSLSGAANAGNHLAAALVGLLLGHPIVEVVEKLSQLREVPGRGQRLVEHGQATVVIDAAGSPQRAACTLRTQRSMKAAGRLWCVLAIDDCDSPAVLAQYGTLLERFADQAVVTAQPNSKKSFMSASHAVLDGVQNCAAMRLVADQRRGLEWAMAEARAADTIVVLTGQRMSSAHDERRAVDQFKNWVDQARQTTDESETPTLKIFN